ncbi:MAG: GNAT family N-acetyltransferase [Sphingomonadales bacterium]|nr:GNAT family N-acetyltransferase [Sphingomonadales bacterium]
MTAPTPRIRPASTGDGEELLALIHAHAAFEQSCATITSKELAALLAAPSPRTTLLVAAAPGHLLGYAALTTDFSLWRARYWAHLDCLFVHAEHRGQSVGRRLLTAAAELARSRGADRLEWQTPEWNTPAIHFYRSCGAAGIAKVRFTLPL